MEIRTRYAPSPTGYMHIGNLRTALYEYLIAKSNNGKFILRLEDTDQERFVEGATEVIYHTLKTAGLIHDEGPDIGGPYDPYIQSKRLNDYIKYAHELVDKGCAYYCFCTKKRLDKLHEKDIHSKYDRHCHNMSNDEVKEKLKNGCPYVIRQLIPTGKTTFNDEVFGTITIDNEEIEDQILIKSDGYPTYNFANVIDDHLMNITHVLRGSEYLSSSPKYNLLYEAFGWDIPIYMHLPLILNEDGQKLSKRKGDASFEDLLDMGYLPEAIVNYIALLGWSPSENREMFTLGELIGAFDPKGLSKSPSVFDIVKLKWMNSEYIKSMNPNKFYNMAEPYLKESVKKPGINYINLAKMVQPRIEFIKDVKEILDFIDNLPEYTKDIYIHKKMKTTIESSIEVLNIVIPKLTLLEEWDVDHIEKALMDIIFHMDVKNGFVLWPVRTALSGKLQSPCGAAELAELLGKNESIKRLNEGIHVCQKT